MALGCVPRNATHTDFENGSVSEGRVWYIVKFAGGARISSLPRAPSSTLSVSDSVTSNPGLDEHKAMVLLRGDDFGSLTMRYDQGY